MKECIFLKIQKTSLQPEKSEFTDVCKKIVEDEAIVSEIFYIKGDNTPGFPLIKPLYYSTGEIALKGLSTNIGVKNQDASGKKLGPAMNARLYRLRKLQRRSTVSIVSHVT